MLRQRTPMSRGKGFARPKLPRRRPALPAPVKTRAVMVRCGAPAAPIAKEGALQHQGYMNLVRAMPCARCGHPPRSQFCHMDLGKGAGIKSDCRLGWPGCDACHRLIGSTGKYPREEKRQLEHDMSARTRAAILASGKWPKRLPLWEEKPPLQRAGAGFIAINSGATMAAKLHVVREHSLVDIPAVLRRLAKEVEEGTIPEVTAAVIVLEAPGLPISFAGRSPEGSPGPLAHLLLCAGAHRIMENVVEGTRR